MLLRSNDDDVVLVVVVVVVHSVVCNPLSRGSWFVHPRQKPGNGPFPLGGLFHKTCVRAVIFRARLSFVDDDDDDDDHNVVVPEINTREPYKQQTTRSCRCTRLYVPKPFTDIRGISQQTASNL